MAKSIIALLLFFFWINFSIAQTAPVYIFAKKIENSVLLGAEVLNPSGLTFNWSVSAGTFLNKKTTSQIINIPVNPGTKSISGKLTASSAQKVVVFEKNFSFELPKPRVILTKYNKNLNLILPLNGKVSKNDSVFAMVFDFFKKPKNLRYDWTYNNSGINAGQIFDLNSLNIKSGDYIEVIVSDAENSNDYATDTFVLNF